MPAVLEEWPEVRNHLLEQALVLVAFRGSYLVLRGIAKRAGQEGTVRHTPFLYSTGRQGIVLCSDVWGKFQKLPDGVTESCQSSSLILTCGLLCERQTALLRMLADDSQG